MSEFLRDRSEHPLLDLAGSYYGFGPSDESDIGVVEMRLVINEIGSTDIYPVADEVFLEQTKISVIRELTAAEFEKKEPELAPLLPKETRLFDLGSPLTLLHFAKAADPDRPRIMIVGGIGDAIFPTMFFDAEQVQRGLHEQALTMIEAELGEPGDLPRLPRD